MLPWILLASAVDAKGGAVETVAAEATRSLGGSAAQSVVVSAPLESDKPAPRGDDLAIRLASRVAARLGSLARAHPQTAPLGAARAIAGRTRTLVYLRGEVARGDLRATVDVYPPAPNVWDRVRDPSAYPVGHASASAKIDAGVRAFLTPLAMDRATVGRARHDEGDVLAAACGDVDGDGRDEILLVSRSRIALGRVTGEKFVAERALPWGKLATVLPVPMRQPLAGAALSRDAVYAGTTDRGGVELGPDLAFRMALVGIPVDGGDEAVCLRPEPAAGAFDGAPVACLRAAAPGPKMAVPAPRFDAFAAASLPDANGRVRGIVAVREPSGKLRLKVDDATIAPEGLFGAQLAVGDLDQDGVPDIVTTAEGTDDAVRVLGFAPGAAQPIDRARLPAPSHVHALAMCPPDDGGQPVLVVVTGDEVWQMRAAPVPAVPVTPGERTGR